MEEMTYRLEYSNNQKRFFLNYNRRCRQNTNGYITIFEDITDMEFAIFEEYLYTAREKSEWSDKFVKDSAIFIRRFTENLLNRNISFSNKQKKEYINYITKKTL